MISQNQQPEIIQGVKVAKPEEIYLKDLKKLLAKLPKRLFSSAERDIIEKAFYYAYEAHRGRQRYSKEPYFVHCLEAAKILTDLQLDTATICGGFLHDVVEDTNIPLSEIEVEFGKDIALLVDGVTKISGLKFESFEARQVANIRKMLLSMSKDLRVILIKFADRLHNMRTIEHLPPTSQERIARETLEVYAPLAHRFGIAKIKSELEDLSFRVLNYDDYREIASLVAMEKEKRDQLINQAIKPIKRELKKFGVKAEVNGRAKHLYSIHLKLRGRGKSFDEIFDLLAIRIIVNRIEDCYFVLGVVHNLWAPMHEKFTDYIAAPKLNMYRSLHTKVRGPDNRLLEIQIRTQEMHLIAEEGIAAHWRYKEKSGSEDGLERQVAWVRQFLDWQSDSPTPEQFLDDLREDLFTDEVFLFTPRGRLITLPNGATPVDFAFVVHSDIGLHCIGAKVNKKIVPLDSQLQSGDVVEIITSANQKPSQDWLRYVVSPRAKSKIKRWLKESQLEQSIKLGQELLTRELAKLRIKSSKKQIAELVKESGFDDHDVFYAALGNGDMSLKSVINRLNAKDVKPLPDGGTIQRLIRRVKKDDHGVKIQGMDDILISFAECCRPLPGDKVVGFVTTGKGISVHRADCKNARRLVTQTDREIDVEWDVDRDQEFHTRIRLLSEDRRHLLRDITESLSPLNINIIDLEMKKEGALVMGTMVVQVKDLSHLTKVLRRLHDVKGIVSVVRLDEEIEKSKND
ncbi:(p)ppGpp synthetase [candidate division LCP-89 bacterium B3_LCP]|uniref:(P)ppGpp synthetase n=1 Tax=candidate division LCP-89 bacterium B3_LCP TaxID=2012998 RepID=A0A532V0F0_UNCL8|nr:MAG: (p)ppGpp synthetase [candidate division LCP-89 bacterium B3_LCP]